MADEPQTPPELSPDLERIRVQASLDAYNQTQKIIDEEIEKQKANIRNGKSKDGEDGGLWGWIQSIIFMIAEFFNMGDWVAEQFGGAPGKAEKDLFARTVAEVGTKTAFAQDYGTAKATEEEVSKAVRAALNDLKARGQLSSFDAKHIETAALEAGKAAGAGYKELQGLRAAQKQPVIGATQTETVGNVLDGIIKAHFNEMKPKTKGEIKEIGTKFIMDHQDLVIQAEHNPDKLKELVGTFTKELLANPEIKQQLNDNDTIKTFSGNNLEEKTNSALTKLLDIYKVQLAIAVKAKSGEAVVLPTVDLAKETKEGIVALVADGVKATTAVNALAQYNDSSRFGITRNKIFTEEATKAVAILNTYYETDGKGTATENYRLKPGTDPKNPELLKAQGTAYAFAVDISRSFNDAQRTKIGELVADVIKETRLPDDKIAGADTLQKAIEKKLKEHVEDINQLSFGYNPTDKNKEKGTTVENVNYMNAEWHASLWSGNRWDVLGNIAKVSGDLVRNTPGAYEQLKEAHTIMSGSTAVVAQTDTKNAQFDKMLRTASNGVGNSTTGDDGRIIAPVVPKIVGNLAQPRGANTPV